MAQINWQYQVNNRAGGYIVTNTDWNDVAGDLRALIDQTTSSTTDNTPLPIGIDLANDRVYISDPDSTTPEDANHADTTLSVVGTTTLAGDTQQTGTFTVGVDGTGHDVKFFGATATNGYMLWDESEDELIVGSAVKVGLGTASPVGLLDVNGAIHLEGGTDRYISYRSGSADILYSFDSGDFYLQDITNSAHVWYTGNVARMRVDASGNVIVGGTTAFSDPEAAALTVVGNIGATVAGGATVCDFLLRNDTADSTWLMSHRASGGGNALQWWYHDGTSWVGPQLGITTAGAVAIAGALSKGSGSFDIPHPTKGGDWRLRHSFIEGPQADLIYRGTVTLTGGSATVDLDDASNMTDGTWEALCRDPWTMVASSGNAVEWSLSGKTLTITSDTADAVCNWMVIAERQDDHMKSPEGSLADDDGYLIVEYEREASPPPAPPEEAEEAA